VRETIVVLGAAGGVGSTLVQLACHRGIRVIGTAGLVKKDENHLAPLQLSAA